MGEITAGRYRMRNGQEAVVLIAIAAPNYTVGGKIGDAGEVWTTRGTWRNDGKPHPYDLIERLPPHA